MLRPIRYVPVVLAFALVLAGVTGIPASGHITSVDHTWKKHIRPKTDGRYFTKAQLSTGDGDGPNLGSNRVHWENLNGVPEDIADGGQPAWLLAGNAGTTAGTDFLGTTDETALELRVNSLAAFRLEPNATSPNVIGGFNGNNATATVVGATIGGGGASSFLNSVTDDYGFVGGGRSNTAGDGSGTITDSRLATVGGGEANTASGLLATIGGGDSNTASATGATVGGGEQNTASGIDAMVGGGGSNDAIGIEATVGGGDSNTASGTEATVGGGLSNTASGDQATIGGGQQNSASFSSATVGGGVNNTASTTGATVAGGSTNIAGGFLASVGGGNLNAASQDFATVAGGLDNDAQADFATIAGGGRSIPGDDTTNNVVTDNYGTVGGGGNNQAGDAFGSQIDRPYGTVGGGFTNTASGAHATVGGGFTNNATAGRATVGGGNHNTASATHATVAAGSNNTASGENATVGGGEQNFATGAFATVPGGNRSVASLHGQMSHASGMFDAFGDAQASEFVLRNVTADDTPTELFLDGSAHRLTIAEGQTVTFEGLVAAHAGGGDSAGFRIWGVIENFDGTTSLLGVSGPERIREAGSTWDVTFDADDVNGALRIRVTGETGKTIRWVASIRTSVVSFPAP